jgi:hypothetical protein
MPRIQAGDIQLNHDMHGVGSVATPAAAEV